MSMSTHVVGFVAPDDKWRRMKEVWDACKVAKVGVPDEVDLFFRGEQPDDHGMKVELPVTPWSDDSRQGYELAVSDIPKNVSVIRFYNSW